MNDPDVVTAVADVLTAAICDKEVSSRGPPARISPNSPRRRAGDDVQHRRL